ncbi:hypothetical protein EJB05_17935, partial [Eragrostis curvula]
MDFQKGILRCILFFLFEMSLAAALTVLVVFALANIGRSSDMLTKGNYTKIGVQSPEEILYPKTLISRMSEFAELAELLPKVATDDRTVIITSVNEAFARPNSLLGVFRESFRAGEGIEHLLNHVLVDAVDAKAFLHCKAVHLHCYLLEVRSMNLRLANNYMRKKGLSVELVWTKLALQERVLELGSGPALYFRGPWANLASGPFKLSCFEHKGKRFGGIMI